MELIKKLSVKSITLAYLIVLNIKRIFINEYELNIEQEIRINLTKMINKVSI